MRSKPALVVKAQGERLQTFITSTDTVHRQQIGENTRKMSRETFGKIHQQKTHKNTSTKDQQYIAHFRAGSEVWTELLI